MPESAGLNLKAELRSEKPQCVQKNFELVNFRGQFVA